MSCYVRFSTVGLDCSNVASKSCLRRIGAVGGAGCCVDSDAVAVAADLVGRGGDLLLLRQ